MRIKIEDIDGISTRYLYEGSGPALLLVHGVGGSGDMWLRNVDALGEHYAVYAPDNIGHGFTASIDLRSGPPQPPMVKHLGALMDHVGAERYAIAGSSYGALLAGLMYFDRPERIDKLILIGSGTTFQPGDLTKKTLEGARANATTAMGDPTFETCHKRIANICFDAASVPDELIYAQLTSYALPDRFDFYRATIAGLIATVDDEELRVYKRLEMIAAPTLIITGREDIRSDWKLTEKALGRFPDAELVILDRCGHLPMSEHPDKFNDLTLKFLAG